MQLIQIYNHELDAPVQYRVYPPQEIKAFIDDLDYEDQDEFVQLVLKKIVGNLNTEVAVALSAFEDKRQAIEAVHSIYNGCVMLNPGLNIDAWNEISRTTSFREQKPQLEEPKRRSKLSATKIKGLSGFLRSRIVGQDEAIDLVASALKRSAAGISTPEKPLGVFLFSGASGTGKTQLAKELQKYLFEGDIIRMDCGEFQHKHENQKILGAPPSYVGHASGGALSERMKENPKTVVLLDEVEKAHKDIWDTFLRVFDEGILIDGKGDTVSFRDAIIIMTTNLGNKTMVEDFASHGVGFTKQAFSVDDYERYADKEIRKYFRPEFINRIDKVVYFNYLGVDDLQAIASLLMSELEARVRDLGIILQYSDSLIEYLAGNELDPVEGARSVTSKIRNTIEDKLSDLLLDQGPFETDSVIHLGYDKSDLVIEVRNPDK